MFPVLCREPVAIGFGLVDRDIHDRMVLLSFVVSKSCFERGVFGIGNGRITDVGIRSGRTAQYHPAVIGVFVPTRVYEPQELLLNPHVAVLYHLVHDSLHMFHDTVSLGLALQFAELVLFSRHHLVVADTHPVQKRLSVGICRIPPVLNKQVVRLGIHFRSSLFHERGIGLVELQLTLHQVSGTYECSRLHRLMHAEIMGHKAVVVDGKPVPSVEVARQSGDVIVLAGREAELVRSFERDDGAGVFHVAYRLLPKGIYFDPCRTCQRIAIDAFQFDLRYARKPDVELYSAICSGVAIIPAVFVRLNCRNYDHILFTIPLCGYNGGRRNGESHC